MAYEVVYTYHDKLDEGGYDIADQKTLTKRYGKGFEEMPLEKLAANVINQLSRRDIWITDVKVYEFVKKEIKFKETKGGGIVLSGRKFTLDSSHPLVEEDENQPQPQIVHPQQTLITTQQSRGQVGQTPQMVPENRPALRYVVFEPPQELMEFARLLQLTRSKRYPIYEEKVADQSNLRSGMLYYMRDDLGRGIWARSFYFQDAVQLVDEFGGGQPQRMPAPRPAQSFVDSVRYESDGAFNIPDIAR